MPESLGNAMTHQNNTDNTTPCSAHVTTPSAILGMHSKHVTHPLCSPHALRVHNLVSPHLPRCTLAVKAGVNELFQCQRVKHLVLPAPAFRRQVISMEIQNPAWLNCQA